MRLEGMWTPDISEHADPFSVLKLAIIQLAKEIDALEARQ